MTNSIEQLFVEQEIALLRADLAASSPESYTLEEMCQISEDLDAKTEALDEAIREDFNTMSPEMQVTMFEMLTATGAEGRLMLDILDGR